MAMNGNPDETHDRRPIDVLYDLAQEHAGYLTVQQAIHAGVPRSTVVYHAREGGALERVDRGLYRVRRYPSSSHEHVVAAWLPLADADAVVSHESALELYELSDVIPDVVHVTMPRSHRYRRVPTGAKAHFTERPVEKRDRRALHSVVATGIERTVADVLKASGRTEQLDMAVRQALRRGVTTPKRLERHWPRTRRRELTQLIAESSA